MFLLNDCVCLSGKKILKPAWFEHAYCGLSLGYAKDHQTCDSYVRYLLCKQDAKIASRGITTFWEYCRGMRNHRLHCLVRLRRGLALRKQDGTLMSEAECDACAATLAGETVTVVDSCPSVTVIEALQIEAAGRSVWGDLCAADDSVQIKSLRLFVCLVVDAMYRDCDFSSVRHLWDLMVSSNSQHAVLFGAACREADVLVIKFFVHCMSCYMCLWALAIEIRKVVIWVGGVPENCVRCVLDDSVFYMFRVWSFWGFGPMRCGVISACGLRPSSLVLV